MLFLMTCRWVERRDWVWAQFDRFGDIWRSINGRPGAAVCGLRGRRWAIFVVALGLARGLVSGGAAWGQGVQGNTPEGLQEAASRDGPEASRAWLAKLRAAGVKVGATREQVLAAVKGLAESERRSRSVEIVSIKHEALPLDADWDLHVVYESPAVAGGEWLPLSAKVQSLDVRGFGLYQGQIAPGLFEAVRAVHRSPKVEGSVFDPLALVRAVNVLHALGKDRALQAVEAYVRLTEPRWPPMDRFVDDIDPERVFLVLRLLFVRGDGHAQMPEMLIGAPEMAGGKVSASWPLFPLGLEADVPFLVVDGYELEGVPESPSAHVEFCRRSCHLRERPLRPEKDPLAAVDALVGSASWKELDFGSAGNGERWVRDMVRTQALRAALGVVDVRWPDPSRGSAFVEHGQAGAETEWAGFRKQIGAAGVEWEPAMGRFVKSGEK